MLTQIFLYCLAVSVWGALLILLLCVLRPITGRMFGAKWQYYSCLPVLLVLLLPLFFLPVNVSGEIFADFAGKINLLSGFNSPQPETELLPPESVPGYVDWQGRSGQFKSVPDAKITAAPAQLSIAESVRHLGQQFMPFIDWQFWALVWLIGAMLLLVGRLLIYGVFRQHMLKSSVIVSWSDLPFVASEAVYWQNLAPKLQLRQLKVADEKSMLTAPFVSGLRRPCLLLPAPAIALELSATDWQNLLRHELTHYQRHDVQYKWLLLFAQCLHWFNPLVYLLSFHLEQDCEISCDLAVTSDMTENERCDYMRTILRMLTPTALVGGLHTGMSGDKRKIKRRFEMINKHKINSRYWQRGLAVFCSTMLVMLALGGSAFAAAQATNLELVASAKTVDNGVVWSVISDNDAVKRVDEISLYTNVNGIVVYNNGEAINFNNKPYLTPDGKIYLPLREMLERFQIIEPNDNSSLQYDNGLVKLELYQWQTDAAGGRVLHCFYQRQFNMTDNLVGAQMHNDVIYVPAEMLLGIAQMSAVEGSSMLDGLMILQYDQNGGEVLRMVSLPLLGESKMVNTALFLPERFALVTQFAQAWQQSDYQKMQSFCTKYVLESVGWQYADVMLGQARAVYAEQWAAEPNSLNLHVLIIRPDGQSGYSELAVTLEVEQQKDGKWLISGLRSSSSMDAATLSKNTEQHWQWPLDDKYHIISASFGGERQHSGIDIPAVTGAPVYAVSSGKVLAADYMGEDGNKIILQHSDDGTWETRYSHLSSIAVKAGNVVEAGQVIGYVGSTGKSTGAHLHLSILQNGQPLDPMSFFEQK